MREAVGQHLPAARAARGAAASVVCPPGHGVRTGGGCGRCAGRRSGPHEGEWRAEGQLATAAELRQRVPLLEGLQPAHTVQRAHTVHRLQ